MTDILIRNFSVARKPRSLQYCNECKEPCYPGLPRYRVQFFQCDGKEHDGFLHTPCAGKWFAHFLREHRDLLKKENK
jgi:hypothetical protein